MAYYWTIPFCDIDGNYYKIQITKPSGATEDTTLTGAAKPFVTQEDDDEDMFVPVRGQSGYIRIVDDGYAEQERFDWHDLIPEELTSRPVTLLKSEDGETWSTAWLGFIEPQTFQGNFNEWPQEREFPVISALDALEAFDFDPGVGLDPFNFGKILYYIFFEAPGDLLGDLGYFYFQGLDAIKNNAVAGWLFQKVSPLLFYETDDDGNQVPKYNCLEVLQYVCQFFGWTCRISALDIWFVAPGQDIASWGFSRITQTILSTIAGETSGSYTQYNFTSIALGDDMKNTENSELVLPGVRKVTVTEDVAKIDNIFEVPMDEVLAGGVKDSSDENIIYGVNSNPSTYGSTGAFYSRLVYSTPLASYLYYKFSNLTAKVYIYSGTTLAAFQLQDYDDNAFNEYGTLVKKTYNYSPGLRLTYNQHYSSAAPDYPEVTLTTRRPVALADGVLVLNISQHADAISDGTHKIYNGAGVLYVRICIGDYFWNESSKQWSTRDSATDWGQIFGISLAESEWAESAGSVTNRRTLSGYISSWGPYPPYKGYGIPIPSAGLCGKIEVTIYGFSFVESTDITHLTLSEFSMEFLRGTSLADWNGRDKNKYISESGTAFTDAREISNIFAVDENNAPGDGLIISPAGGYISVLPFTPDASSTASEYLAPGQHLADAIADYYSQVRRLFTLNIANHSYPLTPQYKMTYDSSTFYVLSQGHDWAEDVTTVKLIEL